MNANLILAVLLSLATTALGRAPVPKVDPVQRDRAALQGTWSTVSVQSGDHASGEDTAETLTYKWNTYTQSRNGRPYSSGTFKIIDAKSKPKQIEFTVTDGSDKGAHYRSIYILDGDKHAICSVQGENRPTEFSGKAGFYRVTKRVKK